MMGGGQVFLEGWVGGWKDQASEKIMGKQEI